LISEREEEDARDLFSMPGWKNLVEEWEDQLDLCTLDSCNTIEELHFQKGRAGVLRMMLNYEAYIKNNIGQDDNIDPVFQ
jgi:hypothetical protein